MKEPQLGHECLQFLKLSIHNGKHEQTKHLEKKITLLNIS